MKTEMLLLAGAALLLSRSSTSSPQQQTAPSQPAAQPPAPDPAPQAAILLPVKPDASGKLNAGDRVQVLNHSSDWSFDDGIIVQVTGVYGNESYNVQVTPFNRGFPVVMNFSDRDLRRI